MRGVVVTALLGALLLLGACSGHKPTPPRSSTATMPPTVTVTPVPTGTPQPYPPTREGFDDRTSVSAPNPLAEDGTPWELVSADPADPTAKRLVMSYTASSPAQNCDNPISETLALWDFGGGQPQRIYHTPDNYQLWDVSVGTDFIVFREGVMAYNGLPAVRNPFCINGLVRMRLLKLDRSTGTISTLLEGVEEDLGALAVDGEHLVYARSVGPTTVPIEERQYRLVYRNLRTGAERDLLDGTKGGDLRPLALHWPTLVWSQSRSDATSGVSDVYSARLDQGDPLRSQPLLIGTTEVTAAFAGNDLYLVRGRTAMRFRNAMGSPESVTDQAMVRTDWPLVVGDGFVGGVAATQDGFQVFDAAGMFFAGGSQWYTTLAAAGAAVYFEYYPSVEDRSHVEITRTEFRPPNPR